MKKKWNEVNEAIGNALYKMIRSYKNFSGIGRILTDLAMKNDTFIQANKWFSNALEKFDNKDLKHIDIKGMRSLELDPVQLYLSFNMSSQTYANRLNSVKVLYSLLKIKVDFGEIDFSGCPRPVPAKAIQFKTRPEVRLLWELFIILKNGKLTLEKGALKKYLAVRGIAGPMFSIFCFWVNPRRYMPVDKFTLEYLAEGGHLALEDTLLADENIFIKLNKSPAAYLEGKTIVELIHASYNRGARSLQFKLLGFKLLERNPDHHQILNYKQGNDVWYIVDKRLETLKEKTNDDTFVFQKQDVDIYNSGPEDINININAIVGKNGSGKSTLLDLVNMVMFNLSYKEKLIQSDRHKKELAFLNDVNFEIYFEYQKIFKWRSSGTRITLYEGLMDDQKGRWRFVEVPQKDYSNYRAIFYTIVANYSLYSLNTSQYKVKGVEWLSALTHKNDSYQTPIVITPQREDDMIDVNKEKSLTRQRLLLNLLDLHDPYSAMASFRSFDNDKIFTHVKIVGPSGKVLEYEQNLESRSPLRKDILKKMKQQVVSGAGDEYQLLKSFLEHLPKNEINILFKDIQIFFKLPGDIHPAHKMYLVIKLFKIVFYYNYDLQAGEFFRRLFRNRSEKFDFTKVLRKIKSDNSHITDKFKQVINYLTIAELQTTYNAFGQLHTLDSIHDRILEVMALSGTPNDRRIRSSHEPHYKQFIIPPIFEYEFYYNNTIPINRLSSGEQQLIAVTSNILYHIRNIASKHTGRKERSDVQYRNVNVILDEIELYFHPEYQRRFISRFIANLKKLAIGDDNISSINILFTTHSPFILSDILSQKTLLLRDGSPVKQQDSQNSFAANIYDLLKDEFFMEGGNMGEFAKGKINDVIRFLNLSELIKNFNDTSAKNKMSDYDQQTELVLLEKELLVLGVPLFREDKSTDDSTNEETLIGKKQELLEAAQAYCSKLSTPQQARQLIDSIGEPILRNKLAAMYGEVFQKERLEMLKEKELMELAKQLNYKVIKES